MESDKSLLITIVTVSYNVVDTIEATICSVINQSYLNIEYIIIDGGSSDGTVDVIKQYEDRLAYWVSEPDNGIYDAMNKGIQKSNGHFLLFLNSGDCFDNHHVLTNFDSYIQNMEQHLNTIFLGDILCYYKKEAIGIVHAKVSASPWYTPPHQGMFIPLQIIKKCLYDSRFRYLADRELLLRMKHKCHCDLAKLGFVISTYDLSGISSNRRNSLIIFKEAFSISKMYHDEMFLCLWEYFKSVTKYLLSFIINEKLYFRMLYSRKR
ncbi:glycosyltransferase family 2 protein [uncultured Bacteroides sp.]|uniref:glycosyltransferase family 2 protein n=1 Tax=uncultured Bacteroides sp. TaxID=162156 RepID=UPI0025E6404F|nr:glycosyltransferase family 2 protein [uncultured Bacteroides sp.]